MARLMGFIGKVIANGWYLASDIDVMTLHNLSKSYASEYKNLIEGKEVEEFLKKFLLTLIKQGRIRKPPNINFTRPDVVFRGEADSSYYRTALAGSNSGGSLLITLDSDFELCGAINGKIKEVRKGLQVAYATNINKLLKMVEEYVR